MGLARNEIPLEIQLGDRQFEFANVINCPNCDFDYSSFGRPSIQKGNDNYEANWPGRGDLLVIPFQGECGHKFEVCFGFHKGNTHAFIRPVGRTAKTRQAKLKS